MNDLNREWSGLNKTIQSQLGKKETFIEGIRTLIGLRDELMRVIMSYKTDLTKEDLCVFPFMRSDGSHCTTIAWSLWHIFRIEDIVSHTLINEDEQVFFTGNYREHINSPIITTGNELTKGEISDFSKQLDVPGLFRYITEVKKSTEKILNGLSYDMLKKKIPDERKECLRSLRVVSEDESSVWLIDFWCGKDIRGLIRMPLSRHWIMHVEACERIRKKLQK